MTCTSFRPWLLLLLNRRRSHTFHSITFLFFQYFCPHCDDELHCNVAVRISAFPPELPEVLEEPEQPEEPEEPEKPEEPEQPGEPEDPEEPLSILAPSPETRPQAQGVSGKYSGHSGGGGQSMHAGEKSMATAAAEDNRCGRAARTMAQGRRGIRRAPVALPHLAPPSLVKRSGKAKGTAVVAGTQPSAPGKAKGTAYDAGSQPSAPPPDAPGMVMDTGRLPAPLSSGLLSTRLPPKARHATATATEAGAGAGSTWSESRAYREPAERAESRPS